MPKTYASVQEEVKNYNVFLVVGRGSISFYSLY